MRLALKNTDIHAAGAEVAAVSVDDEVRQAGMSERWKLGAINMISDPGGTDILQPLDLFDPDERDGIALPGMVIVDPDGTEVYRYQGRDFADRTNDDDIFETLAGLDLPPSTPVPGSAVSRSPTTFAATSARKTSVRTSAATCSEQSRFEGDSPIQPHSPLLTSTARCPKPRSKPGTSTASPEPPVATCRASRHSNTRTEPSP